jgi:hypothetical protein
MNWIKDLISPETRSWEEFYRNRWQHDKVIWSTLLDRLRNSQCSMSRDLLSSDSILAQGVRV